MNLRPPGSRSSAGLIRLGAVILAPVAYVIAFVALAPTLMVATTILALIPVAALALRGGVFAGLAAGLLSLPVNAALLTVTGAGGWSDLIMRPTGIVGWVALVASGVALGWLQDTRARLRRQTDALAELNRRLHRGEMRFRTIATTSPAPIVITSLAHGRVLFANDAWAATYGIPRASVIGRPVADLYAHDAGRADLVNRVREHGQVDDLKLRARRPDGTTLWIAASARRLEFEGADAIFAVFIDISEREAAEARIREGRERLQALLDTMVDAVITITELGLIRSFNAAAEQMFRYTADEVIGQNVMMLMPEPYRSQHEGYVGRYLHTGEPRIIGSGREVEGRRRDGSTFPMDLAVSETVVDGRRHFVGVVRDITARRTAEDALVESESRYALVMNAANEGIWDYDIRRQRIYRSARLLEFLGLDAPESAPHLVRDQFVHPDDLPAVDRARQAYLDRRAPEYVVEYRAKAAEGTWRWVRSIAQAVWDEDGRPIRLVGSTTDITDEREASDALKESERRFRAIAEAIPVPTVIATADGGRIMFANERMIESFGLPDDYLTSVTTPELYADRSARDELLQRLAHGKAADGFETTVSRRDGTTMWASISARPVTFEGNAAVFTGFIDITARRIAERAIEDSERRFRSLFKFSNDAIIIHDLDGRIVDANQRTVELTGRPMSELIGSSLNSLRWIESGEADDTRERLQQVGDAGGVRFETRLRGAGGIPVDVEISARVVDRERGLVQGIMHDVSARKRTEAELRALDRRKDEFVSTVSHELRTPLTSIRVALNLLADEQMSVHNGDGRKLLDIAVASTDRLVRLVDDTLDLDRMKAGRATLHPERCDVGDLIAQVVDELQPVAEDADLTIEAALPSIELRADPDRIMQVLTNLLGNAIKFSPARTTVFVGAAPGKSEVIVSVRDQGPGLPPEDLHTIFDRFNQAGDVNASSPNGFGLGLAICESIVDLHGGRIWAESTFGEGSTFRFALPVGVEAAA